MTGNIGILFFDASHYTNLGNRCYSHFVDVSYLLSVFSKRQSANSSW